MDKASGKCYLWPGRSILFKQARIMSGNSFSRAVIFDMDGLMIDTEPYYKRALRLAAAEFGYEMDETFLFGLIGLSNTGCQRKIQDHFGPEFPMEPYWSRWPELWREVAASEGIAKKPGIDELHHYLSTHSVPMAIATSSIRPQAEFSLQAAGVDLQFSHIVTGDQVSNGKPAPDIFLEAARRLGVDPADCIALEDSENGIRAATSAGMKAIMVPDMKQPDDEVRQAAWQVVDDLFEARDHVARLLGHEQSWS